MTLKENIAWNIMKRSLIWDGFDPYDENFETIMETNWYTNGEIYLDYADAAMEVINT